MRKDNFEVFYEKFKYVFENIGLKKDDIRDFFLINCGNYICQYSKTGEWNGVYKNADTYQLFRAESPKGKSVMITPDSIKTTYTEIYIGQDGCARIERKDKVLMIEKYNPIEQIYKIDIYTDYPKDLNNINLYGGIFMMEFGIEKFKLLPDFNVTINNDKITVEEAGRIILNTEEKIPSDSYYKRASGIAMTEIKSFFEQKKEETHRREK